MLLRKFNRLFAKSWFRKLTHRMPTRTRLARPLAVELLEERTLLSHILGTAGNFAVLGGQAVTNTGPSVITGDLGISPNPLSSITGFPPGSVIGATHGADAVAAQAQIDLAAAYDVIAGRTPFVGLTNPELGGLTLTPGVYHFSSEALLTGTLILDFQGNPNAEFDFQIVSALTTASGSKVVLINGGDPCEVYWQVGSSATLGTTTAFVGNILALTSIFLRTGASVDGSVLARNGEVTLDTNKVSIASCGNSSISGLKFNDLNGNGVGDLGEPGLPGVTIFLDANTNGVFDIGERSTTTDALGNYTFTGLVRGTYIVREVQQAGFTQTTPNPVAIVVSSGIDVSGVLFGNFQLISISGSKFQDTNGNGIRNPGEAGLARVTIFLDANNNGAFDIGERSTTTDINGNYSFANVAPGTYRVREVLPTGFTQTTANPVDVVASSGTNVSGQLIGNFQLISITGSKFRDSNGDGVRNTGELGLQRFVIYLDTNNNGVLNTGEISTTTDTNGNFSFANLAIGTYRVREVGQPAFVQMTNNPANIIVTTSGANVTGILFGNIPAVNLAVFSKLLLTGNNLANLLNGTFALQANFVANLYQTLLGRAPDLAGLKYYLKLLQAGFSEAQVAALIGNLPGGLVRPLSAAGGFDPATGVLTVFAPGSSTLVVRTSGKNVLVLVDGEVDPSFNSIVANLVSAIVVQGGDGANLIDLRGVTEASYSHVGGVSVSVFGGDSNDTIFGSAFNDSIQGEGGNDSVIAGSGNDSLSGGGGNDTLDGGAGTDLFTETSAVSLTVTNSKSAGLGTDTLKRIEQVLLVATGGSLQFDTRSFSGNATLIGGDGNDTLLAGAGNDSLFGGLGDDILVGGSKNDSLVGGAGRDILIGGLGKDTLSGDADDDILIGGTSSLSSSIASLNAIMSEWTSGNSYATRVANLTNGGGANGTTKLNNASIQNDASAADELSGNSEMDWFFQSNGDVLIDFNAAAGEITTAI